MELSKGRSFYERQIATLMDNQSDWVIDNHYHKDAVFLSFGGPIKGSEALKKRFRTYLNKFSPFKVKSTDKFIELEQDGTHIIFFEATVTHDLGEMKVYDVFMLRDEKIFLHVTGTPQLWTNFEGLVSHLK